jgi:PAS domain S-box-containing protein
VQNQQLAPSDQRLAEILDSLLLGALIIDPRQHTIIYANPEAARVMGREPAELFGRVCHNFICPVAVGKCPITDLEQQIDRSERCVLTHDGQQLPILKTVRKIEFKGGIHLLETFMDISALKEKERLMGVLEMAGATTHHLAQPLQIILTSVELLQKPQSKQVTRNLHSKLMGSMRRLKATIEKIQNITRYRTEEYVQGKRIVDITRSSSSE